MMRPSAAGGGVPGLRRAGTGAPVTQDGVNHDRPRQPGAVAHVAGALAACAVVCGALAGCREEAPRASAAVAAPPPAAIVETVGDVGIAPLEVRGLERLSPAERAMAYYLARATLAGRDIAYDEGGDANLEIRDLLEEILIHPRSLDPGFRDLLLQYLKRFWIENGNHDRTSGVKFVPAFTYEALRIGARSAQADGAAIRLAVGESLAAKMERLRPAIFDPAFEPVMACAGATAPVTAAAKAAATEPQRARRAAALRTMTGFLAKAAAFAGAAQRADLDLLARAAADGGALAWAERLDGWLRMDPPIDIAVGPGATCRSEHGREGGWTGVAWVVDPEATRRMRALSMDGAVAAAVILGIGAAGPATPQSIGVPEMDAAGGAGGRVVLLANVLEAEDRAWLEPLVREFAAPEDRPLLLDHGRAASFVLAALHALVGHEPPADRGPDSARPDRLSGDDRAVLDEARADLRALDRIFDDRLSAVGFLAARADAEAGLRLYLVRALAGLRAADAGGRIAGAWARAARLIAAWLAARDAGIAETRVDGVTTLRLTDVDAARRGVAALLAEVERLLANGGGREAHAFVERFANRADPALRAEIAGRAARAGIPSRLACLMPDIIPVRDGAGEVIDARVGPSPDFTLQMLRYSGKLPSAAEAR
jgi:dipeptidyl-peptidase-3